MRILKLDQRHGVLKAIIRSADDLVVLSYIIEPGDRLVAYTRRKIVVGVSQEIRTVKLGVSVEKVELEETSLGISGKIDSSSDENVPLHKYHTIYLKPKTGFVLFKSAFLKFQVEMVRKSQAKSPKVFICVYEEGYAIFYKITNYSLSRMYEMKERVSGKRFKDAATREAFLDKLSKHILDENRKGGWDLFIVAGKAIDNEDLKKNLSSAESVTYETVSYADTGLKELINKDRINELLKGTKISSQRELIKEYLGGISDGDKDYVYGKENIVSALSVKAPVQALVTREFITQNKNLIESIDRNGAEIIVFDEADESLEQLIGFGGVLLKF